jgi:CHAT domain-containing protein
MSACESGLGDVRRGEGVLGLARGFALAGARTLVASLWKVPDDATAALVERFYADALGKAGTSKIEALRRAQLALLRGEIEGLSEETRRSFRAPTAWGGFVVIGAP